MANNILILRRPGAPPLDPKAAPFAHGRFHTHAAVHALHDFSQLREANAGAARFGSKLSSRRTADSQPLPPVSFHKAIHPNPGQRPTSLWSSPIRNTMLKRSSPAFTRTGGSICSVPSRPSRRRPDGGEKFPALLLPSTGPVTRPASNPTALPSIPSPPVMNTFNGVAAARRISITRVS